MGIPRAEVERVLESVGFGDDMRAAPISSLSGGWKMKLALGECFLWVLFSPAYGKCAVSWLACVIKVLRSAGEHDQGDGFNDCPTGACGRAYCHC